MVSQSSVGLSAAGGIGIKTNSAKQLGLSWDWAELGKFWTSQPRCLIKHFLIKTSSARAEISDGLHKGGLRRAGPNDFIFLFPYFLFLSFCFVRHVLNFLQLKYTS